MSKDEAVNYWLTAGKRNLKTASDLNKSGHFDWSLFIAHLALEKTIKGLVVKQTGKNPLPIHNLIKLAKQAKLKLSTKQEVQLDEINSFNLETRYDDYKFGFYKKANKEYSDKWMKIIKQIYSWLKKHY